MGGGTNVKGRDRFYCKRKGIECEMRRIQIRLLVEGREERVNKSVKQEKQEEEEEVEETMCLDKDGDEFKTNVKLKKKI